ncbi:hypothetical protein K3495_g2324 [Podosphaera aphanis]|nr:hypothetical protein K3495_g2324 [Podosphaera aphanis]
MIVDINIAGSIFESAKLTGDYCWVVVNGITFFNVYKASNDLTAIRPFIGWIPSRDSIGAGDFNSIYEAWQPNTTRPHGQGEEVERWAERHQETIRETGASDVTCSAYFLTVARIAEPGTIPPPAYVLALGTKESDIEAITRWANHVPGKDIYAYSDGSSEGHGRSAWGFVLKREDSNFLRGSGILHGGEVIDAEIIGARYALEVALRVVEEEQRRFGGKKPRIHILLDSQQALKIITTGSSSTRLEDVRIFYTLSKTAEVVAEWVHGHSGI